MPPTLPIDLSNFPALQTRKALLILDLQNEFLSTGGNLPVSAPAGYVERTLGVAKAFRESGTGDVFWIRSQFDSHRPVDDTHIITTPSMPDPGATSTGSARGRQRAIEPADQNSDLEAFLSKPNSISHHQNQQQQPQRSQCLLPGSFGSEMAPHVASAIDAHKDLIIAKSHYSAFESTQLLMRLRMRFVTELYICGALTNISIYATALDAARHGLTLTIIEDCCGYRSAMRHNNALTSLVALTGCETLLASQVFDTCAAEAQPQTHLMSSQTAEVSRPTTGNDFAAAIPGITSHSHEPPRMHRLDAQQAVAGLVDEWASSGKDIGSSRIGSGGASAETCLPVRTRLEFSSFRESPATLSHLSFPAAKAAAKLDPKALPQPVRSVISMGAPGVAGAIPAGTTVKVDTGDSHCTSTRNPIPPPPIQLQIDPGEITPDNGESDVDTSGDSFLPVIPSRNEKMLQYSRLRANRHATDTKNKGADCGEPGGNSRPQYQSQTVRVQKNVSKIPSPSGCGATSVLTKKDTKNVVSTGAVAEAGDPIAEAPEETSTTSPTSDDKTAHIGDGFDAPLRLVDSSKQPAASEPICAGDTIIYHDVLPTALEDGIYERLCDEIQWLRMSHQGGDVPRLVCVQGGVGDDDDFDDAVPVYRHPADVSPPLGPFTPTVLQIKRHVEAVVGHSLNHVLIQYYRSGSDYISEHSDKTLDIVPGSYICNMSLGAERMMIFRTKRTYKGPSLDKTENEHETNFKEKEKGKERATDGERDMGETPAPTSVAVKRQAFRVPLPHNSLCRMGLQTNMKWLHAIRQDKRADRDKTVAELAFGGGRISLTFRQIGTFLNKDETLIWGQGAVSKTRADARPVINDQSDETIAMLRAFAAENRSSSFDWTRYYGHGFDVLHMNSAPRFFASTDGLVNLTVQLLLADLGISYARGSIGGGTNTGGAPTAVLNGSDKVKKEEQRKTEDVDAPISSSLDIAVMFVDNDHDRSTVQGVLAIMLYLDAVYGTDRVSLCDKVKTSQYHLEVAQMYTRLQQALLLQDKWRRLSTAASKAATSNGDAARISFRALKYDLMTWNAYVSSALPDLSSSSGPASEGGDEEIARSRELQFIAGSATPSLADYAVWSVLLGMEQAISGNNQDKSASSFSSQSLELELEHMGATGLSSYYAQFKARRSVDHIFTARKK